MLGSEKEARKEAKEAFILDLVRRGKISKGKAAELMGITLLDLPDILAQYNMPWFNYTGKDAEKDIDVLNKIKGKDSN